MLSSRLRTRRIAGKEAWLELFYDSKMRCEVLVIHIRIAPHIPRPRFPKNNHAVLPIVAEAVTHRDCNGVSAGIIVAEHIDLIEQPVSKRGHLRVGVIRLAAHRKMLNVRTRQVLPISRRLDPRCRNDDRSGAKDRVHFFFDCHFVGLSTIRLKPSMMVAAIELRDALIAGRMYGCGPALTVPNSTR